MKKLSAFAFAASLLFFATSFDDASAQCCNQGFHGHYRIQSGGRVITPNPPYFAIHPPVSYDRVVSRAYGFSPYATPPGMIPAENTIEVLPKAVSNPYYNPAKPIKPQPIKPQPIKPQPIKPQPIKSNNKKKNIITSTQVNPSAIQSKMPVKKIVNEFYKKPIPADAF